MSGDYRGSLGIVRDQSGIVREESGISGKILNNPSNLLGLAGNLLDCEHCIVHHCEHHCEQHTVSITVCPQVDLLATSSDPHGTRCGGTPCRGPRQGGSPVGD